MAATASCVMAMGRIALACDANGIACFDRIRHRRNDETVFFLYAFDLVELNGDDLRRDPLELLRARRRNGLRSLRVMLHDTEIEVRWRTQIRGRALSRPSASPYCR
jgi:ATP-dependent DNA ligase